MLDKEWQVILNEINSARNLSDKNVIDKIKEKLAKKYLNVYIEWKKGEPEKKKFNINYLFSFRSGYINNSCTLLYISAYYGLWKVVTALLACGADINIVDSRYGATPLHWAAENGHINVVRTLLKYGAGVNAVDKNAITPLHLAARSGHTGIVEVLFLKGADINVVDDKYGITPLHGAAGSGCASVVGVLLKKGADINAMDKNATTPLHVAVGNNHIEVVNVLLKNKANVDAINIDKATPLHWAARNGHIAVIRVLLKNGANALLKDKNAKTPGELTLNDDIKQLLSGSKERKCFASLVIVGAGVIMVITFGLAMLYGSLTFTEMVTVSVIVIVTTAIAAVVVGIKYNKPQPSTQVNEMHEVGVRYTQHNSEISMT